MINVKRAHSFEMPSFFGSISRKLHYLYGADGLFAIYAMNGVNDTMYYVHKDALGSIDLITNTDGDVEERLNFDPWLGRFHSPDPFVQFPAGSQSYNRYSYCLNNPLKYVDPSGYGQKPFFGWEAQATYYFGGGFGGRLCPGSGNHWSDAMRSDYGNFMLMSSGTYMDCYGQEAYEQVFNNVVHPQDISDGQNQFTGAATFAQINNGEYQLVQVKDAWGELQYQSDLSALEGANVSFLTYLYDNEKPSGGGGNGSLWAGALAATAVIAGDDVTGIGVLDDVAIPFIWAGAASIVAYKYMTKTTAQYVLTARTTGDYPVYVWGSANPLSYVYLNAGDVWKYGITSQYIPGTDTQWRYSQSQLNLWNVDFRRQYEGTRTGALIEENLRITNYFGIYGTLPPGNKIFR